jgi:hypothetical protein
VSTCMSCWAWSDFATGGGAPGLFCFAASMHVYASCSPFTVRPQLASLCTAYKRGSKGGFYTCTAATYFGWWLHRRHMTLLTTPHNSHYTHH